MPILWRSVLCLMGVTTLVVAALTTSQLSEAQSHNDAPASTLTPLVRGVIVRFKDGAVVDELELESALPSQRLQAGDQLQKQRINQEWKSRKQLERATQLISDTGLPIRQHRDLGSRHHVMQFERPLLRSQANLYLKALQRHPAVAYAEPDELMQIQAMPASSPLVSSTSQQADPDFSAKQWFLQPSTISPDNLSNAGAANFQSAWAKTTGSDRVVVAVVDTGIRPHADLQGRLLPGYDFVTNDIENGVSFANDGDGRDPDPSDPGDWISATEQSDYCGKTDSSWHGTFIAGLIGANANNGIGIAGANWQSKILPVRVSGKCGAYASNIIDGMRWAAGLAVSGIPNNPPANKARVINLSFGGSGACGSAYQAAVDEVIAAGALVVVAAGNEFAAVSRPANCQGVLAVGAARHDGLKANYSNFGSQVSLMAPGGSAEQSIVDNTKQIAYPGKSIWSTSNAGLTAPQADSYSGKFGTSFAAPLVAAAASLMLSVNPSLSVPDLIRRLKASTRPHVRIASLQDVTNNNTSNTLYDTGSFVSGQQIIGTSNCTTATCGAGLLDADAALVFALKPAVNILIVGMDAVSPGQTLVLDGSQSAAASDSVLTSYVWTQQSGDPVLIQTANSSVATVTTPSTPGTFVFRLTAIDRLGREGYGDLTVVSMFPVAPAGGGGGGGAFAWSWGLGLWLILAAQLVAFWRWDFFRPKQ